MIIGSAFRQRALIGDVVPTAREAEMMGLRSTAKGGGGVIGPAVIGTLATVFGYVTAFAIGSLLAFLVASVAYVGLTESHESVAASVAAD